MSQEHFNNKRPSDAALFASPPFGKKAKINTSPPAVSFAEDVDERSYDASSPANAAAVNVPALVEKPKILTFTASNDNFARLKLLSTHTLYDLVSTLCQHTPVGYDGREGPDDNLWSISYNGREFESFDLGFAPALEPKKTTLKELALSVGSALHLNYDCYGCKSTYLMVVCGIEEMNLQSSLSLYPRNQLESRFPASYQTHQPNTGSIHNLLDVNYAKFNEWAFSGSQVTVNLFQAGRKKNYGFCDNQFTMMYLPVKPDSLSNWLECFNQAASIKPAGLVADGYAHYTWQSVVPLPRTKLTEQLINKYKSNEKRGFRDAPIVEDNLYLIPGAAANELDALFPKTAALAGLRKDKLVPKGWISFTKSGNECSLTICKGNAKEPHKSKAPKGLAFEGEKQHVPVDKPLFHLSGDLSIRGLNDLFCIVEGLLKTL